MSGLLSRICTALLAFTVLVPALAVAQTEPVQFMISGTVEDDAQAPVGRAQIIVSRNGTGEVLAQRIFTEPDGSFTATFQALVVPNVRLDDPTLPTTPHFDGYWMGEMWPNPYTEATGRGATLPFAAPANATRPDLEMFDARGRRIRNGELMASGVYFYRLRFEGRLTDARKLVLLSPTRIQPELQRVAGPTKTVGDNHDPQAAARRAEGELAVEILVIKDGYIGSTQAALLDSRSQNPIAATLNPAPLPGAQLSVAGTLTQGSAVTFDGIGSTDPDGGNLNYSWDFGDGVRGGGELVAHVYGAAGTYDIELTVSTAHGATATATQQITVAALTPASTGATAVGTIRDAVGNLLTDVTVTEVGGTATGMSDAAGVVTLTNLPTDVPVTLECTKTGFTKQIVRLELPANTVNSSFDATLRRQRAAVEIGSIEDGGDVEGEDGVCVELPADALLKPDGTPATGKANVRLTPIDVTNGIEAEAFPGSYTGVRTDGEAGLLLSYGVAEFVIEQNSEELQLKPGSTAFIEIPIYTPGASVDDLIPLWSVDETTGLWTEEGTGTVVASEESPSGLALRAEVTHFSWWNADAFDDDPYRPIPECKIKDEDGLPTLVIPPGESCYINGVAGPGGPTSRPYTNIGPNNPRPLPMPANITMTLSANALNGTKVGTLVVNGASGVTEPITIVIDDLNPVPNELVLPADFEAAIDVEGEIDTYTFEAQIGQDFGVAVMRNSGSTLDGTLRILDPDATEVYQGTFGASVASYGHIVTVPGTYTIEVDGTANEPGGYRLIAQYSETFEGSLPMAAEADIYPGMLHLVRVHMEAGEWFNVDYVRRETLGAFGSLGTLKVLSPSGAELYSLTFGPTSLDTGLLQATETGEYVVMLQSQTIQASYGLFVRDVPQIPVGGQLPGTLTEKGTQYYRFDAEQDDFLRSAIDSSDGFTGDASFVDGNNGNLNGSWVYTTQGGSAPTTMPATGPFFVKLHAAHTQVRTTRSYRVSLNEILPPEPLTFDAAGRAQVNGGQIGLFGDMRLYSFAAPEGAGVFIELNSGDVTTLTTDATVHLYQVGFGTWQSPQTSVFTNLGVGHYGDASLGILEVMGNVMPADDTYIVAIASKPPEDGEFDFTLDLVSPTANITVDDDLVENPGADTRSLYAALLCAPDGATVSVSDGLYSGLVTFTIGNGNVEVVGSHRDDVTLRMHNAGWVLSANDGAARIANLTLEPSIGNNSTGLYLRQATGSIIEDLRIGALSGELETGITLGSGNQNLTVRRVDFDFCQRNIEGRADNLLVEDCLFDTGAQIFELQGDQITLQNNTWNVTAIGEAMSIDNGAGHQILDNVINVTTPDNGAPARTFAMSVEDADEFDALPQTVIRGNVLNTNEAGMYLAVDHAGSSLLCEQNSVIMVDGRGQTGIETIVLRDAGNDMTIQNNVLVNTSPWRGLHLRWPDRAGQLTVFNNSLAVDSSYNSQVTYPTVRLELAPGSTATGALPVEFVNNVLQGAGAVAIEIPTGTTIDSDYNLLNGYSQYYLNGGTSSGTNDLLGVDPLITGALLELDAASPAVDSGRAAGAPAVDHDGTARPQGGGVDRGAHEQ